MHASHHDLEGLHKELRPSEGVMHLAPLMLDMSSAQLLPLLLRTSAFNNTIGALLVGYAVSAT